MSGEYDMLRAFLSDRVIAFHPRLALALGGVNEALFFQQIAYWSDKGGADGWIYKTQPELQAETTLTRTQQENARKRLKALGVLEEARRGLPAQLHYRIVWERAFALLEQIAGNLQSRLRETGATDRGKPANQIAGNPPTLTEMTTKKIKETDSEGFKIGMTLEERAAWLARRRQWKGEA